MCLCEDLSCIIAKRHYCDFTPSASHCLLARMPFREDPHGPTLCEGGSTRYHFAQAELGRGSLRATWSRSRRGDHRGARQGGHK